MNAEYEKVVRNLNQALVDYFEWAQDGWEGYDCAAYKDAVSRYRAYAQWTWQLDCWCEAVDADSTFSSLDEYISETLAKPDWK